MNDPNFEPQKCFYFILSVMNNSKLKCVQKHILCNERPFVFEVKNWSLKSIHYISIHLYILHID